MKNRSLVIVLSSVLTLPLLLTGYLDSKDKKKPKNDACAANDPGSICHGPNTCGSLTSECQVDIRRIGQNLAAAKPNIANAKDNDAFCVKVGTTITFKSSSRDTGFVLDFGSSSPFDSGTAIMGGADRPISVVAKKPGCYTYSVGACTAGGIYGMCGEDAAQFIVSQ